MSRHIHINQTKIRDIHQPSHSLSFEVPYKKYFCSTCLSTPSKKRVQDFHLVEKINARVDTTLQRWYILASLINSIRHGHNTICQRNSSVVQGVDWLVASESNKDRSHKQKMEFRQPASWTLLSPAFPSNTFMFRSYCWLSSLFLLSIQLAVKCTFFCSVGIQSSWK